MGITQIELGFYSISIFKHYFLFLWNLPTTPCAESFGGLRKWLALIFSHLEENICCGRINFIRSRKQLHPLSSWTPTISNPLQGPGPGAHADWIFLYPFPQYSLKNQFIWFGNNVFAKCILLTVIIIFKYHTCRYMCVYICVWVCTYIIYST